MYAHLAVFSMRTLTAEQEQALRNKAEAHFRTLPEYKGATYIIVDDRGQPLFDFKEQAKELALVGRGTWDVAKIPGVFRLWSVLSSWPRLDNGTLVLSQ